jgi:hypothetical protein
MTHHLFLREASLMRWIAASVVGFLGAVALGQQAATPAAAPETTGTVVGHVYLADTGGPARLAKVALQPVEVKSDDRPEAERRNEHAFQIYRVGLDGSYRILHVKPGVYYVVVKQPGYLSPFAMFTNKQLVHPTPDDQQKIDAYLPMITVVPNNTATLDVRLTRGASLGGTVSFDDGQPFPDTRVTVMQKDAKGEWKELGLVSGGYTDDLGHFRITGLLGGTYLLHVNVSIDDMYVDSVLEQPNMMSSNTHYSLDYYSGDTARKRDAKPIDLDSSQEMSSANITIPVSKLHAVSGAIVEAKSGRAVNSGAITLTYGDGDGQDVVSTKVESDEPVFRMPFVPEGSYTIKASDAADVSREEISNGPGAMPPFHTVEKVIRKYGTAEQPLVVTGDVSGVNLAVTPVAKTP